MLFPYEIIDTIVLYLPPLKRLQVSIGLRRLCLRDSTIPIVSQCNMDAASRRGDVSLLDWWKNSGRECNYSTWSMDDASKYNHVTVLEWWKQSGLPCKWSHRAMDDASLNGHVSVLEWWKSSSFDIYATEWSINWASLKSHIAILEWWKRSGLEFRYSSRTIQMAVQQNPQVAEWWRTNEPSPCNDEIVWAANPSYTLNRMSQ
jgi:hypothetical protein